MTAMNVTSDVELYDSDFLKIERGPLAWANSVTGSRRNVDDFVNKLKDEFIKIGFFIYVEMGVEMECRCSTGHELTACPNLVQVPDAPYIPQITISGRTSLQPFDYEQMQHEVRSNILNMPGQDKGTIKFDEKEFLRQYGRGHKH